MNRTITRCILFAAGLACSIPAVSRATNIQIATVPVGAAGNATDPATGYGAVAYNYNIGTYDVTDSQYAAFLNSKATASDPYGLWNSVESPAGNTFSGGISRSGSGPYTYSVATGYANKPVVGVSWYDAVRFVNWLQNGQGNGDTESGTYTITGGGNNSGTVTVPTAAARAAWASAGQFHWLLPSENEWYKAAYYDPTDSSYYAYPFQSDTQPTASAPPGGSDSGNFYNGGFAAYNSDGYGSYLTDVGSYTGSLSPFGSYDMGGDVWQWNEADISGDGSSRGLRGSSWYISSDYSAASFRVNIFSPADEYNDMGFRVASVP